MIKFGVTVRAMRGLKTHGQETNQNYVTFGEDNISKAPGELQS